MLKMHFLSVTNVMCADCIITKKYYLHEFEFWVCISSKYCCQHVCVCACEWVGECLELAHVQGQRHTNDIDASGVFYKLNCSH